MPNITYRQSLLDPQAREIGHQTSSDLVNWTVTYNTVGVFGPAAAIPGGNTYRVELMRSGLVGTATAKPGDTESAWSAFATANGIRACGSGETVIITQL